MTDFTIKEIDVLLGIVVKETGACMCTQNMIASSTKDDWDKSLMKPYFEMNTEYKQTLLNIKDKLLTDKHEKSSEPED